MSERDPGEKDHRRRRLEGVIPELLKRAVEIGVEKATEAPDTLKAFVGDLKVPKEVASVLLSQIDETKNGLFRVVAKEVRDFLDHTNVATEMKKMLTTVQFEINTTIRFTPNDGGPPPEAADGPPGAPPKGDSMPRPEVKTEVSVTPAPAPRTRRRARE